jgi:transcriptional regulator with XRE-family HTH domain
MNKLDQILQSTSRTRQDMAEAFGVSEMTISNWANDVKRPHTLRMYAVLKWLGEPMGRVLTEAEVWE